MLKKPARWMLFTVACLVTLVALFYAEEDWRGKHAWETYKREREARGISFDWSAIAPPSVPDNENLAAIPFFSGTALRRFGLPIGCSNRWGVWWLGTTEDLSGWYGCFSNTDPRTALSKYEPILHQITEASYRPFCRFPICFEDSPTALFPYLEQMRNLARVYRVRALVELSAGETGAALEDIKTCLRLIDKLQDEQMASFFTRMAMLGLSTQPVWEGLVAHRWDESQLTALQEQFERIDQFKYAEKSLQWDRLFLCHTILWVRDHPSHISEVLSSLPLKNAPLYARLFRVVPVGWFYQNQLDMVRLLDDKILPAVDWEQHRVSPAKVLQIEQSIKARRVTPYNWMALHWDFPEAALVKRAAISQTQVDETIVACALERYRLAHGVFPETLDALVPQFISQLPLDVIDGLPLHYRHLPNDQYLLYSIGWNEKDDGGQIVMNGVNQNFDQGNWVWFSQPQSQPPGKRS